MADASQSKTFRFELVSPEKVLFSEDAVMAVIPGEMGEFGVLAGHAPLLSSLRPGVVTVHLPAGGQRRIFVAGGFADVGPESCAVLAEEAVDTSELDRATLERQVKDLEDDLTFAKDDAPKAVRLAAVLDVTRAKIGALA